MFLTIAVLLASILVPISHKNRPTSNKRIALLILCILNIILAISLLIVVFSDNLNTEFGLLMLACGTLYGLLAYFCFRAFRLPLFATVEKMPFCARCGSKIEGETAFCSTCGAAVARRTSKQVPQSSDGSFNKLALACLISTALIIFLCFLPWVHVRALDDVYGTLSMFGYSGGQQSEFSLLEVSDFFKSISNIAKNFSISTDELDLMGTLFSFAPLALFGLQSITLWSLYKVIKTNQSNTDIWLYYVTFATAITCLVALAVIFFASWLSSEINEQAHGSMRSDAVAVTVMPYLTIILSIASRITFGLALDRRISYQKQHTSPEQVVS